MSDKERVSASVDPEVAEYLKQNRVNASGLINDLVKQHQSTGGTKAAMLELRHDQVKSEVENLHNQLQAKRKELDRIETQLSELQERDEDTLDEATDKMSPGDFETNALKVSYWTDETGLTEEQLREELEKRWNDT